ncbi:MAG: hypothetical protein SOW78_07730 [Clostridia bacterium]|nr:hypothetical protein [Clostridia bacterium]
MKKVQIYFPNLFETGIKDFIIDDYFVMNKIEKGKSILFLGDKKGQTSYAGNTSMDSRERNFIFPI